jgi:hypothetical protein
MPYKPTKGLVTLFARTGMTTSFSRAPVSHTAPAARPLATSYADALSRIMEGDGIMVAGWDREGFRV